ncbi:MAG: pilus assembly protein TadG-related protein [Actinobacteria bacterium]|nr:pilus assembly protein TadG-related protein [Actinomycetota bacterium]
MRNFFSRLIKDQKGMSFFIVCVGITALFGMTALVTDFGRISLARQRLVNAADSAAMAGARDLCFISDPLTRELEARQRAIDVAKANGAPEEGITVNIENYKVSVDAEQDVNLIMSRLFGVTQRNVKAHAAATVESVKSYLGIAPLSIKDQTLEYGQMVTLKFGSPNSDTPGNFGALALNGRGSMNYEYNLINGSQETVTIGDVLETEPGNMSGPTEGIDERLSRCTDGCTFDNFRPGCPKILVIPMHLDDPQGRDTIKVTGFAAFFVDREATLCQTDEIKGYFVQMASTGSTDSNKPIVSLYDAKLVE